MGNSLCFVLMPFNKKPDASGRLVDFDAVYQRIIRVAIDRVGLEPIRADEEQLGGIIHKPMFERLVLCEYAVADLTLANANVYYELGVRHALRPWRTIALFSEGMRLPFDVNYLRAIPYGLDEQGLPRQPDSDAAKLVEQLEAARQQAADPTVDSPVFQLLDYFPRRMLVQVPHEKTDVFRSELEYEREARKQFAAARKAKTAAAVDQVLGRLKPLPELEAGVVIDAMLSYRAVEAWDEMVAFIERMPRALRDTVMVQEQLGFALNRAGLGQEAEETLKRLLVQRGPSPETLGILGRVYKDRWEAALKAGDLDEASGQLDRAIDAYLKGFEADFRDAYPGVNALTLMTVRDPPDERRGELLPIVRYAVRRKMATRSPDYWDHATLLELAVLGEDEADARSALGDALASVREVWEPKTTVRNLSLIRTQRATRGQHLAWADQVEAALRKRAGLEPLQ